MKKLILLLAFLSLLLVNGCAGTAGSREIKDETQESINSKIIKGTTTKQDIHAMFGDPMQTNFTDSGNEVWHYDFFRVKPKAIDFVPFASAFKSGMNQDQKELVILFDQNGVVKNFSLQNFHNDIRQGVGN